MGRNWYDDLDPTVPAVQTVVFPLDGTFYEIDLGLKNLQEWEEMLLRFVAVARKVQVDAPAVPTYSTHSAASPRVAAPPAALTAPPAPAIAPAPAAAVVPPALAPAAAAPLQAPPAAPVNEPVLIEQPTTAPEPEPVADAADDKAADDKAADTNVDGIGKAAPAVTIAVPAVKFEKPSGPKPFSALEFDNEPTAPRRELVTVGGGTAQRATTGEALGADVRISRSSAAPSSAVVKPDKLGKETCKLIREWAATHPKYKTYSRHGRIPTDMFNDWLAYYGVKEV